MIFNPVGLIMILIGIKYYIVQKFDSHSYYDVSIQRCLSIFIE